MRNAQTGHSFKIGSYGMAPDQEFATNSKTREHEDINHDLDLLASRSKARKASKIKKSQAMHPYNQ